MATGLLDATAIALIEKRWADDDWAHHPGLLHLREHTRAYVDRLRGKAI